MASFRALDALTSPEPTDRDLMITDAASLAIEREYPANIETAVLVILIVLSGRLPDEQTDWFLNATSRRRNSLVADVIAAIEATNNER